MALDKAKAGQLPAAPPVYSQEHFRQLVRSIELYFSQLDSRMPQNAEQYTADRFIGGDFHGGRFFGKGFFLQEEFQRFTSVADQAQAPAGTASHVVFDNAAFANSITLVPPGQLHVALPGTYEISFNLQVRNYSAGPQNVYVWLRLNGADVPNSSVMVTVFPNATHPTIYTYYPTLAAGDYVEVVWTTFDPSVYIAYQGAYAANPGASPAIPVTPSAVVLMKLMQAPLPADAVVRVPFRLRNV